MPALQVDTLDAAVGSDLVRCGWWALLASPSVLCYMSFFSCLLCRPSLWRQACALAFWLRFPGLSQALPGSLSCSTGQEVSIGWQVVPLAGQAWWAALDCRQGWHCMPTICPHLLPCGRRGGLEATLGWSRPSAAQCVHVTGRLGLAGVLAGPPCGLTVAL